MKKRKCDEGEKRERGRLAHNCLMSSPNVIQPRKTKEERGRGEGKGEDEINYH